MAVSNSILKSVSNDHGTNQSESVSFHIAPTSSKHLESGKTARQVARKIEYLD
jgi:hypothetical protein